MAECGAWSGIQQHGLLSTTALLDLFEVEGGRRFAIESMRRPEMVEISHPRHGRALIRDNKPLREQFLIDCLEGCTPQQWYELLNRKVFFWVTAQRLETLLAARAYRSRAHDVLTIDTRSLLDRRLADITLAPINTGATLYPSAPPRGLSTFVSIEDYDWEAMRRWRGPDNAVVELTVDYAVADVENIATLVQRHAPGKPAAVLWRAA
jgi:hypothetical protein